jgi:hypothetical protein
MNLEADWHALCINANLHAETSLAVLPEPLRPSLARVVERFVGQPMPKSAAELAARREQEKALMAIVTAIVDLGANGGPVTAAEQLAELSFEQPDWLKFELEIEFILARAKRPRDGDGLSRGQ